MQLWKFLQEKPYQEDDAEHDATNTEIGARAYNMASDDKAEQREKGAGGLRLPVPAQQEPGTQGPLRLTAYRRPRSGKHYLLQT